MIRDLNSTTEPVGTSFPDTVFITFDANPLLPALDLNMIYAGIYGTGQCLASPAVGQQCTPNPPITPVTSPFNFVNNPPPNGQATATFAFSGDVAGTTSTWIGNFTSQFSVPFQTVLQQFNQLGFISNTYSATFSVNTPSPTPETSSLSLLGLGLGFVLLARSSGIIARMRRNHG